MTPKPPTPQAISALLKRAGFDRSDYGRPGVMWSEASTGFSVWKSFHRDHPGQPYVAVQYIAAGNPYWRDEEEWTAYLAEARVQLEKYAEVIRAAGYPAVVRDRGREPMWLTILTIVEEADQ